MKKTIIFDLDGTLVDIEPVFFRIFNNLAREFGFAPLREDEIPYLKQFHLKDLVWQRLGWHVILLPFILHRGRETYHSLVPEISLFSGTTNTLSALKSKGYRIGIVSSSRRDTIEAIVKHYALPVDFMYHGQLFNKARSLKTVLSNEHLDVSETLYVGDEVRDIEACHKINLDIIAVSWGLNSKDSLKNTRALTVDTQAELLAAIIAA